MTERAAAPVVAAFAAIYLIWGSTFLAIRWAVETIPPLSMMAVRCLLGGAVLLALSRLREPGSPWPAREQWLGSALVGAFLFVGCHGLLAHEEQFVPSGIAALFAATIPLFVPLLGWLFGSSAPPGTRMTLSLAAGFAGVALLVASQGGAGRGTQLQDAVLLLVCAFSWALGTVLSRRVPTPAAPLAAAAAPLLGGGVLLVAGAGAAGELGRVHPGAVTGKSAAGLLYLVLAGTVVAFAAFMWLLEHVPAPRVATYAFVNPVVAVLLGWAIADERITAGTLGAAVLIVASVAVAVTARSPRRA